MADAQSRKDQYVDINTGQYHSYLLQAQNALRKTQIEKARDGYFNAHIHADRVFRITEDPEWNDKREGAEKMWNATAQICLELKKIGK